MAENINGLRREKPDVYRFTIDYGAWVFEKLGKAQRTIPKSDLNGHSVGKYLN